MNTGIWVLIKRIWRHFFPLPKPPEPPIPPEPPAEYVEAEVCTKSGLLPHIVCAAKEAKKFIKGTEPTTECQTCRADVYWPVRIGYGDYGALDPKKNYKVFFRILYNYGVNLVRVFAMSPWQGYYPYKKLENGKYDVTQLSPEYFNHLKDFVTEARRYGEIVMLDLFDECGLEHYLDCYYNRNK